MKNTWETLSIGSDESGKGDFFGAPTVAAVKLDQKTLDTLKKQKYYTDIKDSKSLSNDWIKAIAPEIMNICPHHRITLTPKQYNQLYAQHRNINIIFALLHNEAHAAVKGDETRIIDAFASEKNYYGYLAHQNIEIITINEFHTKAESKYLSVALASIIARYHYIKQMEKLKKESGVEIPYGNSYQFPNSVIIAYQKLIESGKTEKEIDSEFVKAHFSTLGKIKAIVQLDS